jgi:DNA adenine methylase
MASEPRPPIKWAGGKTQLLPLLLERIPSTWNPETDLYVEPFVGGGALFFALQPKNAILNDANAELMNTCQELRDQPEEVITALQRFQENYRRAPELYYYEIRGAGQICGAIGNAARFIFLNKAGFNGLYRVNKAGQFNVPWGKNPKVTICDADNLRLCSAALRGAILRSEDVLGQESPLRGCDPSKTLIYCDPPYVPVSKTSNFTAYTAAGFAYADQLRLLARAVEWRAAGAHVILSQAADESLIEQYQRCGFKCDQVQARRAVNSKGTGRGCVSEYIIY